jgi:LPXTG-motif cell wall-anchored protein
VVIPRTLPRTGFDPGVLLMLGGMLVISGVLMLRYSDDTV